VGEDVDDLVLVSVFAFVGDVVAGEDDEVGLLGVDLLDASSQVTGFDDAAAMEVADLDNFFSHPAVRQVCQG